MNAPATNGGKGRQNEQSTTIGVGNATSGGQGSTLTRETMAETGGSGGRALTKPRPEEEAPAAPGGRQGRKDQAVGTAATAINRGYQDTRGRQASPGSTGLGAPETGANQDEGDPPAPSRN